MSMGGSPIGRGGNLPPVPQTPVESSTAAQTSSLPQQGAELRALLATAGLLETQASSGVQAVIKHQRSGILKQRAEPWHRLQHQPFR